MSRRTWRKALQTMTTAAAEIRTEAVELDLRYLTDHELEIMGDAFDKTEAGIPLDPSEIELAERLAHLQAVGWPGRNRWNTYPQRGEV
jgi:hypothetical protein